MSRDDWWEFVSNHLQGTAFHAPFFHDVLRATPQYEPFVFFLIDDDNRINALLTGYIHTAATGLASHLSKRAVLLQSPLYRSGEDLYQLLQAYTQYARGKAIYSEIRNHILDEEFSGIYEKAGFAFREHLNYLVDCSEPDAVWKGLSESRRRQIRKAQKKGARIVEEPSEVEMIEFHAILKNLYRHKIKKPIAPYEYFINMYRLGDRNFFPKYLLVKYNERVIGGMLAVISSDHVIHEHFIAGLDADYKDQYPSVMATWAALDYACRNNIATFDFMGAGSPDKEYGVREFKERFGGCLIQPGRYIVVHSRLKYKLGKLGLSAYQGIKKKF